MDKFSTNNALLFDYSRAVLLIYINKGEVLDNLDDMDTKANYLS